MMRRRISRRMMLRGAGVAIGLPWLEAMQPAKLVASSRTAPDTFRMIFLNVPNGAHMASWTPSAEGPEYSLSPILTPLQKHRKQLSVFTGLTLDGAHAHGDGGGDHARSGAAFLTGAHPKKTDGADIQNSISVDQVAAQALGQKTRFASLELGLEGSAQSGNCDSGYSCAYSSNLSWRNANSPLSKEIDPSALFDRIFGTGEQSLAVASKGDKIQRRKSVLDFAMDDAKRLQSQLGISDQRKLDEYLYAVRDVENRLVRGDKLKIGEDGIPNYPRPAGVPREWDEHCRLMMDMMALALQADATRVMTFMFANEGSNRGYPEIGAPEGHHDLSHHGKDQEKQKKIEKINTYHVTKLAYLLDLMASIPEGDATLLDHSMVIYGSGISDGDRHNHNDLPIVMAGGGSGKAPAAAHYRFAENTPLCNLYLWMLKQAGVESNQFGDSTSTLTFG
ncbi:MAG: DUF1552 domain-containing protein [Pirellulaceae bacterium]|jgi:hypothetical protein